MEILLLIVTFLVGFLAGFVFSLSVKIKVCRKKDFIVNLDKNKDGRTIWRFL